MITMITKIYNWIFAKSNFRKTIEFLQSEGWTKTGVAFTFLRKKGFEICDGDFFDGWKFFHTSVPYVYVTQATIRNKKEFDQLVAKLKVALVEAAELQKREAATMQKIAWANWKRSDI